MKIYRIYQEVNNEYDTYDSAIVCAIDEEDAKKIHPSMFTKKETPEEVNERYYDWCAIKDVQVEYIGEADNKIERGVILSSFNAG